MKHIYRIFYFVLVFVFAESRVYANDKNIDIDVKILTKKISGFALGDKYLRNADKENFFSKNFVQIDSEQIESVDLLLNDENIIYIMKYNFTMPDYDVLKMNCSDYKTRFTDLFEKEYNVKFKNIIEDDFFVGSNISSIDTENIQIQIRCDKVLFFGEALSLSFIDLKILNSFFEDFKYKDRNRVFLESHSNK